MNNFEYYSPTEVIFGKGAEKRAAEKIKEYGGSRVFIVYGGSSAVKSGLLGKIEGQMAAADLPFESFGGAKPNPLYSHAVEGVEKARAFGADFILAVGGGSVIDTAKGIAMGLANPDAVLWDIWTKKVKPIASTPVGSILTISAAGSELSESSVLTNEGHKIGLSSKLNRPRFAIMNPELTFTLPKYQIACGIADIIMHTLERYMTNEIGNNFTDRVAEALLKNVIHFGREAMASRKNYEAMSELMWCGSLSHNDLTGLGRGRDFSAHKLGHELSARYDIAHGASLTIMWPAWATYVYEDNPRRFAQYAENVWGVNAGSDEERARAGIRLTKEYFRELGLPTCFSETDFGVQPESELEYLANNATANGTKKIAVFHPMDYKEVLSIYKSVNN